MINLTCPTSPDLHITAPVDVRFTNGSATVDLGTYQALRPALDALGVTVKTDDAPATTPAPPPRRARTPKED